MNETQKEEEESGDELCEDYGSTGQKEAEGHRGRELL